MELRRAAEDGQEFKGLLRGWCLGSKAFRKELLTQMSGKAGPEHFGEEIRELAEEKAEGLIAQELKKLGWQESELSRRRKGDKRKIKIALRLRRETTMTLRMDSTTAPNGNQDPSHAPALLAAEEAIKCTEFTILRTDIYIPGFSSLFRANCVRLWRGA